MRRLAFLPALSLLLLAICPGPVQARSRQVSIHPAGAARERGIGPVRLYETRAEVRRELGRGRVIEDGSDYRIGSVTIEVAYTEGTVSWIATKSPAAILFRHHLSDGLNVIRRIVHGRPGWRVDACHGKVFTALAPGGPGTGIECRHGKVNLVLIDAGGVLDGCAVL